MDTTQPRHTEFTPLAPLVRMITWVAVGAAILGVLADPPGDGVFPSVLVSGLVALVVLLELVFGGLKVELFNDRLRVSLGRIGWIRKTVPYDSIDRLEPVTYRPLREFGGWGVRGFGEKQAWTARGNRALVLHRSDGTRLYVGSEHPERLAERVRSVSGRRFDPDHEEAGG